MMTKKYTAEEIRLRRRAGEQRYYRENKEAYMLRKKAYKLANKDKLQSMMYMRKYGITLEDVNSMLAEQGNLCKICRLPTGPLVVDHNHTTGKVRGMICKVCNWYMGKIDRDLGVIERLKTYASI